MTAGYGGRRLTEFRRLVAETYGLVCYLCHEPISSFRAMDVEHIESRESRPDLVWDLDNARPSHGYRSEPEYRCNQKRGSKPLAEFVATRSVDRLAFFKRDPAQAAPRPLPVSPESSEKTGETGEKIEPAVDVTDWIG